MTRRRLDLREAAEVLGTSVDAVRKRIARGTLESEKADGKVYVWLDDGAPQSNTDALISSKDETIAVLREQLEAERQAHAEARRIIAGLVERIPAIEPPGEPESASEPVPETHTPPAPETQRVVASSVSHSRRGMSARVLVLGAIFTVLATAYLASYLWYLTPDVPRGLGTAYRASYLWLVTLHGEFRWLLYFGPFCVVLLFGLSAGYTKGPAFPWFSWPHRWLRRSGRSVLQIALLVAGIPATTGFLTGAFYAFGDGVIGGVKLLSVQFAVAPLITTLVIGYSLSIASLSFMSGAFLGNALRRVGFLGTPKELPRGEDEGDPEEQEVWSPRKEARWGLAGAIIAALISAVASVLAATLSQ